MSPGLANDSLEEMIPAQPEERRKKIKLRPPAVRQGDLKLLLAELMSHIAQVRAYLAAPSVRGMSDLEHKAAYINSLALAARNHNIALERAEKGARNFNFFNGLASISYHLHSVSELAVNVARQCDHLSDPAFLEDYGLDIFFDEISFGLSLVRPALEQRKLKLVLRLCRVEERLDTQYAIRFARLIDELDKGLGRPGDRVTMLMIIHYLERMGDLLLEIGEEMLHIVLGQNLKFSQYQALGVGLRASGRAAGEGGVASIWGGRSGCRINVVGGGEDAPNQAGPVLFKHGPALKMHEERLSLESWQSLWPGLPPAVLAFVPAGPESESGLLLEYIRGETLHEMMMGTNASRAVKELTGALNLMAAVWKETRVDGEYCARFARQAMKRLGPLRALYPELVNFQGSLEGIAFESLDSLMKQAAALEEEAPAPFSARIHGDFNLSNVMRDEKGAYRLIDLHRSQIADYAQDLSVMIVSILRLSPRGAAREKLWEAARLVWIFAKDFAHASGDPTIEARLAFGLARSYLSSARFEARSSRAALYIGYSRHIWKSLINFRRENSAWEDFRLDKRLLCI